MSIGAIPQMFSLYLWSSRVFVSATKLQRKIQRRLSNWYELRMKEEVELQQPVSYGLSGAYPSIPRAFVSS